VARAEQVAKNSMLSGEMWIVPKAVGPGLFLFRVLLPLFTPEEEANGFLDVPPEERLVAVVTVTTDQLFDQRLFQKAALDQLGMWFEHGDPDDPRHKRDEEWRRMVRYALDGHAPLRGVIQEEAWRAAGVEFLEPPVEAPAAPKKRKRRAPTDEGAASPN
jgi:hypothetical protein